MKAQSHAKKGEWQQACQLYEEVLLRFPKNTRAQKGLLDISRGEGMAPEPDISQSDLNKLIELYQTGQLEDVITFAQSILFKTGDDPLVWNVLGAACKGLGRTSEATLAFERVTKLDPMNVTGYLNLGVALKDQGLLEDAIATFQKALLLKPDYPDAFVNLGNTLKAQGHLDQALEAYQNALRLDPNHLQAVLNMGAGLQDQGSFEAALEVYRSALDRHKSHPKIYANMGVTLQSAGHIEDAIKAYKSAIHLEPTDPQTYINLGNVYFDTGDYKDAEDAYLTAISLNPKATDAYNNLSNALSHQGRLEDAQKAIEVAVSLEPDNAKFHANLGDILADQGAFDKAIDACTVALSLDSDNHAIRVQKLNLLAKVCDWDGIEKDRPKIPILGRSDQEILPFSALPLEDSPERHRQRSEIFCKAKFNSSIGQRILQRSQRAKLRIGYFSAEFKSHPVAYLMAKVLETHDRSEFEIFGYSIATPEEDSMRARMIASFDQFRDLNIMSDEAAIRVLKKDALDIAIDLTGHTKGGRTSLFAQRIAPVQINYLGYPGTMGAEFMDYIIADTHLIPPDHQDFYTEKPIYLPHHYQAQDDTLPIAEETQGRSDLGLPDDGFVFCAINNTYKISPNEFDIWMRLLHQVERSVLWLSESNIWAKESLIKEAKSRGISEDRLVFAPKVSHEKYLAQFRQADLFLDTFIYNAGATASNALWAGLPVITKSGQGYTARMAGSLLCSVGLSELVTKTSQEYEDLALKCATEPTFLGSIKQKLDRNRTTSPLFNTALFTRHLENGFQQANQIFLRSEKPKVIYVPA